MHMVTLQCNYEVRDYLRTSSQVRRHGLDASSSTYLVSHLRLSRSPRCFCTHATLVANSATLILLCLCAAFYRLQRHSCLCTVYWPDARD